MADAKISAPGVAATTTHRGVEGQRSVPGRWCRLDLGRFLDVPQGNMV
jgi:hypothetical protein